MSPVWLLWVLFMAGVVVLLVAEMRRKNRPSIHTPLSESASDRESVRVHLPRFPLDSLRRWRERLRTAIAQHPLPLFGWLETIFWLVMLYAVFDHLIAPQNSTTGFVVWLLTIGPHEAGHLICNPFGVLIMFLGGSIWQVLMWLLLGMWSLFARKQMSVALLMFTITGHSFINLAQYIGDAQAKQMPLLFGMDSSHHDWANILGMLNLLPFDGALALLSTLIGVIVVVGCIGIGILTAWLLPRQALGRNAVRFVGNPLMAIRDAVESR
jgi:hypothetical protein